MAEITPRPCKKGECFLLLPKPAAFAAHLGRGCWPVGTVLADLAPRFMVVSSMWLPGDMAGRVPMLKALTDIATPEPLNLAPCKRGYAFAGITLSDSGSRGEREDRSGPLMTRMVCEQLAICHSQNFILPDDVPSLRGLLGELAFEQGYDLICTSGGTGVTSRDITPQATEKLLDLKLPGFMQAMMAASLEKTPSAAISRALAGVIGKTLVINLPGSMKAVKENLGAILPALEHTLAKINDDPSDCGG